MSCIEVSSFIHATEDPGKVLDACKQVFPREYVDDAVFDRSGLRGHHHNPILLLEARIENEIIVGAFIENLARSLDEGEKKKLSSEIEHHIDDRGALYLRLDKQEASLGNIRFGQSDPIRIKIKLRQSRKTLEETVNIYFRFLRL